MYLFCTADFFNVKHDYHEHVNIIIRRSQKKCLVQFCVSLRIFLIRDL